MNYLLLSALALSVSCSSIQKIATRSATPLFKTSSDKLTREGSWEFFKESTPANLKFMEMLYLADPGNQDLLGILVKGYAGYAFSVPETLYFGDELSGKEQSKWKHESLYAYTKALDYGLEYLQSKSITRADILTLGEAELEKKMNKELGKNDLIAVLYLAQSWGSLINLQKDNIALVAQVPKVKALFDWVCKKDPNIDHGVCDIFYAQYEAARPRMLGGNPEKAEELYQLAMKKFPKHLLIRVGYLQFMVLPGFDQEKYEKEAAYLREEFQKFDNLNRDSLENKSEYQPFVDLNLFNAIAKKRFEMIEKNKAKIF